MKNYFEEYKKWCESPEFDEETKRELLEIKNDEKEINEDETDNNNKPLLKSKKKQLFKEFKDEENQEGNKEEIKVEKEDKALESITINI